MEAGEANNGNEEETSHAHDGHTGPLRLMAGRLGRDRGLGKRPLTPPSWVPLPSPNPTAFGPRQRIRDGGVCGTQSLRVVEHVY